MNDSQARPSSVTREEADLRMELLQDKITLATFNRRYNRLKREGLIKRNGKVIK